MWDHLGQAMEKIQICVGRAKSTEKIYPWNFENVIDVEQSAKILSVV